MVKKFYLKFTEAKTTIYFYVFSRRRAAPAVEYIDRVAACSSRLVFLYAVHEDVPHPHIHFVMNYISYLDGSRYRGDKQDYWAYIKELKSIAYMYHIQMRTA